MNSWDTKKLSQILPFYNTFIEKPEIKKLSNVELLHELPRYDELNVIKSSNTFKGYVRSYRVEITESQNPLVQLEASKSSITDLFNDLLNKMKCFKYQITVVVLLSKHKKGGYTEYSPVYFNSTTVINSEFTLDKSFQEILYRIDNWINEGSGWIIDDCVNISAYSPLIGSTYIELPDELKKGLINIKNNDNKCFLWCHIGHLNLVKIHRERITKEDKEIISKLNYEGIKFPVSKKDYRKIERQNSFRINVFCYEIKLTYPIYLSTQDFKNCMDLLFISNENKSNYVYIKDFNRFMFNKTKHKNEKTFVGVVYSVLVVKKF